VPGEQGAQSPEDVGIDPAEQENFVHFVWSPLLEVPGGHGKLYRRLGGQTDPAGQMLRNVASPERETIRSPSVATITPEVTAPVMLKRTFPVEQSKARSPADVEMNKAEFTDTTGKTERTFSKRNVVQRTCPDAAFRATTA
jgi:hypothetical protein